MAGDVMVDAWIESDDGATMWLDDPPHALRAALAPEYGSLSSEAIDDLVGQTLSALPDDEAFDLGNFVSSLGRTVAPIAAQVLPIAAPAVGTMIGGPIGGMVGSAVGQMVAPRPSSSMPTMTTLPAIPATSVAPPKPAVPNAPTSPPTPTAAAPAPQALASALAGLVRLLQDPALTQLVAGQVLGGAGAKTVGVGAGNVPVTFPTMMNTLATLATQAASASAEALGEASEAESTAYLRDPSGRYAYDPAVPEERAAALLAHLRAGESVAASAESTRAESVGDWLARAGLLR